MSKYFLFFWLFLVGGLSGGNAQEMLDPNYWESMDLIPPLNKEFIKKKGIQAIHFEIRKKKPDERLEFSETLDYSFDWEGNLVEVISFNSDGETKNQFIFEDGLFKIKTTIRNGTETRVVHVFDNYGRTIELQYFRRKVGEVVPSAPFKTEKIIRHLIHGGKTTEEKIVNHFGVQQKSTTVYKDNKARPVEQVIRTPGKNTTIYWARNEKGQLHLWKRKSNYLLWEFKLSYRHNKLDAIIGTRGRKQESIYFQYEGAIPGAVSSILRTNMQTKIMEVVQVDYTTF
ncbi:MAG: hypothetical protein ACJAY8_000144 [Sphingobacteriales bacterium]|jgi:hypothetical protein